jgi:hypothetical protein
LQAEINPIGPTASFIGFIDPIGLLVNLIGLIG